MVEAEKRYKSAIQSLIRWLKKILGYTYIIFVKALYF